MHEQEFKPPRRQRFSVVKLRQPAKVTIAYASMKGYIASPARVGPTCPPGTGLRFETAAAPGGPSQLRRNLCNLWIQSKRDLLISVPLKRPVGGPPMAATPRVPGRVNDRRLYILAAILTPLIVLAGFARTYYLKPFFDTPDIAGRIVHLHGIVMTAWVVLFIVQVSLVATRRTRDPSTPGNLGSSTCRTRRYRRRFDGALCCGSRRHLPARRRSRF